MPERRRAHGHPEFGDLWAAVSGIAVPLMLVRGLAWSVVSDEDVAELQRRQPGATVVGVEGASRCVQGDRPLKAFAALLCDFIFHPPASPP